MLREEGLSVQVPLGAELIQSPGAGAGLERAHHWGQAGSALLWGVSRGGLAPQSCNAPQQRRPAHRRLPLLFALGSPAAGGDLYHLSWGQDPDTGELRLRDYWRDPASAAGATPASTAAGAHRAASASADGSGSEDEGAR